MDIQELQYREQFNVVVVGHVDHGKSTVIGRLLVDTGALPEGKLEQVQITCQRNAKPFEYAFLLDALHNEQSQGITIDTARCFFKSAARDYIIIDAPGHIEFLKNMVTGAARAEAAILVIDAKEGVQENSRRHGYMLSMLGIQQVVVLVNKMDLIDYEQKPFEEICIEYRAFLQQIRIEPRTFLPVSAFFGENLCQISSKMPWFAGGNLLSVMDSLTKELSLSAKPLRFPVQDVYKFTARGDDRRICAGRVETGQVRKGDKVVFYPSGKRAVIASIEEFNVAEQQSVEAGRSVGFTLQPEIYVKQGELMVHDGANQQLGHPIVSTKMRVNLFWLGRKPMVSAKKYKLKVATAEHSVYLQTVYKVLDASELSSVQGKQQIDLHDVADCVLESLSPVAFDTVQQVAQTGRFVIVDGYDIAGGGIILSSVEQGESLLERHIHQREAFWQRSKLNPTMRVQCYKQQPSLIIISCEGFGEHGCEGLNSTEELPLAHQYAGLLEQQLVQQGHYAYYLSLGNMGLSNQQAERSESLQHLGGMAHMFCHAGGIFITALTSLGQAEYQLLASLNAPYRQAVVQIGPGYLSDDSVQLNLDAELATEEGLRRLRQMLLAQGILFD